MHRPAAVPGSTTPLEGPLFLEQPAATLVLLSSADTDLAALAAVLQAHDDAAPAAVAGSAPGSGAVAALNLGLLSHPAVVDHYIRTSLGQARLVLVRLLGGRGHWSYGLEQLQRWAQVDGRQLVVVAGTSEDELALAEQGNVDPDLALALGRCLRQGGEANWLAVLDCCRSLLLQQPPTPPTLTPLEDPQTYDWRDEPGARVGVIFYRALLQAHDLALPRTLLTALRTRGLCPRALWVSGLREAAVQAGVADLLQREGVDVVLCTTAFASVQFEEAGLGSPLWERLDVPVLQVLCSARNRQEWERSSIGLGPLDLSLQVALPELDGRITTRIGAFKEVSPGGLQLGTALQRYVPDGERLEWIAGLTQRWCELRRTAAAERRLALVLANYPTRNSRLANGVGLDTPASVALMLAWLQQAGYNLGAGVLPCDGDALIQALLAGRSNDAESQHRPALGHLGLADYTAWYGALPEAGRLRLEQQWGPPDQDPQLEPNGFPIHGLRFGHVALLIQPSRGYERDPSLNYHSPDLPPTHAYLAQYLWLRQEAQVQLVCHVGKHGNLEWLPGKGLGLSPACAPEWALGPMPHVYPFIVNDPGEGSQAKRRSQAVILDHLTPPLGRAGLHGELRQVEALLDEYWQATDLGAARAPALRSQVENLLEQLHLPLDDQDDRLAGLDGYLCELKEAQIRTGLHTFGQRPARQRLTELLLCLARAPLAEVPGLTQAMALDLGLVLDPWADDEATELESADLERLRVLGLASLRCVGHAVAWLEDQALTLLEQLLDGLVKAGDEGQRDGQGHGGAMAAVGARTSRVLEHIQATTLPQLLACDGCEREAFLKALGGGRIAAGPSGAPTRGRPDLLPTGRNFYSVDLRGLPTEAAWDLGRRSAELLLELHQQEEGEPLRYLALSVWGTATMRNGGEDIAQALALMGVRPIWDGPTRRLVDIELMPLASLGRPRVDVTLRISGLFRDAFPQLVGWFNRAAALVASQPEAAADNPLAESARRDGHAHRLYGSAPGAYGAGLQGLIDAGNWESRGDLGEAYLNWSRWRYEGQGNAVEDRAGLEQRLASVQVVLHNQDNREHDLLDSDDYYQFQGGLSAATEKVRGSAPSLWFGDHSRSQRPRIHRLEKELDKVLRSRVLNPRWIEAMKGHGYKGGFELAATLDYLFAYDASTGRVPDWSYGALCTQWFGDAALLSFLRQSNPWALRDMAERMLEAHHRGLWEGAQPHQLEQMRQLVLEAEALVEC